MIQKQISLPEDVQQQIHERVKQLRQPEEQVITELLKEGLQATKPHQQSVGEGLASLANLGIKGPPDLSQNIDKYLYEENDGE
jgi:hypothetical protein